MKLEVNTTTWENGLIETNIVIKGVMQSVRREIVDTREAHIRKALIDLGWTPPPDYLDFSRKVDAAHSSLKYIEERFSGWDADKIKGYFDDVRDVLPKQHSIKKLGEV